jgi:hypothetical protein
MTKIRTADGVELDEGASAFNYYDMRAGVIGRIDSTPQPDTMKGQNSSTPIDQWSNYWFDFCHEDGSRSSLDGSRIITLETARRKGWHK